MPFLLSSVENGSSIEREALYLEKEILMPLAGTGKALVYQTVKWWSQLKTPGAAIYANRHYLNVILAHIHIFRFHKGILLFICDVFFSFFHSFSEKEDLKD